MTVTESLTMLT